MINAIFRVRAMRDCHARTWLANDAQHRAGRRVSFSAWQSRQSPAPRKIALIINSMTTSRYRPSMIRVNHTPCSTTDGAAPITPAVSRERRANERKHNRDDQSQKYRLHSCAGSSSRSCSPMRRATIGGRADTQANRNGVNQVSSDSVKPTVAIASGPR